MAAEPRLNPASRALGLWLGSRAAVAVLWLVGAYELTVRPPAQLGSLLGRWNHWDVGLYIKIARWGYQGRPAHYADPGVVAFFPGEPLALRAAHYLLRNWVAAGLLVSFVAGAVAVVALARLGAWESGAAVGSRAVLYLVVSPFALFLFAGYSEALFLAFALPAWLALRRGRVVLAGVLAAVAAVVRIDGVFLGVAMLVQYAADRGWSPRRCLAPRALWLLGPFLTTFGYFAYLHAISGDWAAWLHAETHSNWDRSFTAPWTALSTTWHAALDPTQVAPVSLAFTAEIVAVFVGVAVVVALAVTHRWGECVYVGLQVAALATTAFYLSVGRATIVWFPLWLLLARLALTRRWVHAAYLSVAPALMAVYVIGFTSGSWAG